MAPRLRSQWKVYLCSGLAIGTALTSLLFSIGLMSTEAPALLAPSFEARARAAIIDPTLSAGAAEANDAALARAPMTAESWTRKAYLRYLETGKVDERAAKDMMMSYAVSPLDPDISRWRIRFLFENWTTLPPDLRALALTELKNFAHFHKGSGALASSIQNPAGQLAASFTVRQSYAEAARGRKGNEQVTATPDI